MPAKKTRILIVDDDVDAREVYRDVFQSANFEVLTAEDGVEGLDLATKELPDVIFTGIIMPRMDGFSLVEALKKNAPTSNIPVLIFSHMGREEDRAKAMKLGARDFIVRGMMPPNEVVARINAIFLQGEYNLGFDPYAFDAPKLARDFGLSGNFQCMECSERLVVKLKRADGENKNFQAMFVCPKCGWTLR